jgi:protein involved in polysaccharide export with SLBB domain
MNFRLHQPNSGPRVVQKPAPHRSAAAKTHAIPVLLAALCLLFGTSCLLAKDPMFNDIPLFQPATNVLLASMTTNAVLPPNAAGSLSQGGTNSAARTSTNSMDALDDTYHLAIGDRISFRIEEDEDDPRPLTVTDSGDLEVPYIGRYPALGKTCKELAQALKIEFEREYYYRATVIIAVDSMTKSRGKVYLVGAVRGPGPQDIPSDEVFTVSKAVLRAGGFTDYADKRNVKVTRKGGTPGAADQTLTVDVGEILEKGKINSDLTLQAGDLIFIPERLVHF